MKRLEKFILWSHDITDQVTLAENINTFDRSCREPGAVFPPPETIHIQLEEAEDVWATRIQAVIRQDDAGRWTTILRWRDPFHYPGEDWGEVDIQDAVRIIAYWKEE